MIIVIDQAVEASNFMSYLTSLEFTNGENDSSVPHYHVDLNHDHLPSYEIPNSMCLLDHYDHLLMFFECQIEKCGHFPVPLFDVIVIIMTLATVSGHYKEHILRNNDPYNIPRQPLNKRALKILGFYVKSIKCFDTTKYNTYNLELLRCQFFIVIDQLFSKDIIGSPYRSYISCLEQKDSVLSNELIVPKLNRDGEFLNMILWTLSNSLQDDPALYTSSHDVWMPLLDIIIDLIELRHDYFMVNEIKERNDKIKWVESLSRSPLARLMRSIDSTKQFMDRFCEHIFIMCSGKSNSRISERVPIHPMYVGENLLSKTFVPRVRYTKDYKLKKSFEMQRKILRAYFKLLLDIPDGHKLESPIANFEDMVYRISKFLAGLDDVEQLKTFFFSGVTQSLHVIPSIAQGTLCQIFSNFLEQSSNKNMSIPELNLVERLDDADSFMLECISLFKKGFFLLWDEGRKRDVIFDCIKADICLLVLVKRLQYLHGRTALIDSKHYDAFVASINENDSNKKHLIKSHFLGKEAPAFDSAIVQFLHV